jgi:hypothetical protein
VPAAQEPSEEDDEVPSIHRQDNDVENVSDVFVCMDDGWDSDEEEDIAGDRSRQSKLNGHPDKVSLEVVFAIAFHVHPCILQQSSQGKEL